MTRMPVAVALLGLLMVGATACSADVDPEQTAEGYYRAALDTAPDYVPALFNLAILRTKVGATQEAIDLYERVIVIQPEYAAAHLNLGLLYRDANEPKLAQQHLNTAIKLDPSFADRITLDENPAPAPPASASPKPSESASP